MIHLSCGLFACPQYGKKINEKYTYKNRIEIGKDFVKVQLPDGTEKKIECDTVLHALGMKSVPTKELEEAAGDIPFTVIGDAIAPGKVDQATKTGYIAAVEIGR